MRICDETAFCYLTSPFFLQCYKPQHSSLKIVFGLQLINAIDLYFCHRMKRYFMKKEHVRTMNSKKLKISHFSTVKNTSPLVFPVQFCTMNNFAEIQLLQSWNFRGSVSDFTADVFIVRKGAF